MENLFTCNKLRDAQTTTYLSDKLFYVARFATSLWILERVQAQGGSIQILVLASVDRERVAPRVRFCNAPVPFHADNFGPNFVVYHKPSVNNLLNVILLFVVAYRNGLVAVQ